MAVWTIKAKNELSRFFVLAPERYDPRRETGGYFGEAASVLVGQVATAIRQTVTPNTANGGPYLILDTSHAREGIITSPKNIVGPDGICSAKKLLGRGDVIISRLRPYLRQVAFVDDEILGWSDKIDLVCSTEFFPLRSIDDSSIAFLVPFLLSPPIQKILAASQEGGHHPRFDENTLLTLPIPSVILERRNELSKLVQKSVKDFRSSESLMGKLVVDVSNVLTSL